MMLLEQRARYERDIRSSSVAVACRWLCYRGDGAVYSHPTAAVMSDPAADIAVTDVCTVCLVYLVSLFSLSVLCETLCSPSLFSLSPSYSLVLIPSSSPVH